jgi:hypothetical protein
MSKNTVNRRLRTARREPVGNDKFAGFTRRILRAYSRRVAAGDIEALADMTALVEDLDDAIAVAVIGLHNYGYSWTEIGARLGVSRQAASKRWGGDRR